MQVKLPGWSDLESAALSCTAWVLRCLPGRSATAGSVVPARWTKKNWKALATAPKKGIPATPACQEMPWAYKVYDTQSSWHVFDDDLQAWGRKPPIY